MTRTIYSTSTRTSSRRPKHVSGSSRVCRIRRPPKQSRGTSCCAPNDFAGSGAYAGCASLVLVRVRLCQRWGTRQCNLPSNVLGVSADALNLPGRNGEEKVESDEIQAGHAAHHAALVDRLIFTEDGQVNPGKIGTETSTPDHVCHVHDASVLQKRLPVAHADCPRKTLNVGVGDVFRLDPNQRHPVR